MSFITESNLQLHEEIDQSQPLSLYKCELCSTAFRHTKSLNVHIQRHTATTCLPCTYPDCTRTFLVNKDLKSHIKDHSRRYSCTECGREFRKKANLALHKLSIHRPPGLSDNDWKPFNCEICSKRFTQRSKLKNHIRTHLQNSPSKLTNTLEQHHINAQLAADGGGSTAGENVPITGRSHACPICGKAFTSKNYLKAHETAHHGKPPAPTMDCPHCHKKFRHKISFNHHLKAHAGQYRYTCSTCGKKFVKKSHFDEHSRSHGTERPFQCNTCGKAFKDKRHCREHGRRMHPTEYSLASLFASFTSDDVRNADMLCSELQQQQQQQQQHQIAQEQQPQIVVTSNISNATESTISSCPTSTATIFPGMASIAALEPLLQEIPGGSDYSSPTALVTAAAVVTTPGGQTIHTVETVPASIFAKAAAAVAVNATPTQVLITTSRSSEDQLTQSQPSQIKSENSENSDGNGDQPHPTQLALL